MRRSTRRAALVGAVLASLTFPQVARAEWDDQPLGGVVTSNLTRGLAPLRVAPNDPGRPGTCGLALARASRRAPLDVAPSYCTLGSVVAPTR